MILLLHFVLLPVSRLGLYIELSVRNPKRVIGGVLGFPKLAAPKDLRLVNTLDAWLLSPMNLCRILACNSNLAVPHDDGTLPVVIQALSQLNKFRARVLVLA